MPLLGEAACRQGAAQWASDFDVASATRLYWRAVPVTVRLADREEHVASLTVRIMSGVARSGHASRVLRVWVSDESEACFLHTLDVGEEDFAGLKAQQGILVDFGGFPGKLIGLLDRCVSAAQQQQPPRFQAVLAGGRAAGESALQFLETNDFKQLPHLTLAFRPGTDAAVKHFLAFRLGEVTASGEGLASELHATKADRDAKSQQLVEARQQAADAAAAADKAAAAAAAQHAAAAAAVMEAKATELAALRAQLDSERGQSEARLRAQLEAAAARNDALGSEARELTAAKCELEAEVAELRRRLHSAEAGRNEAADEAAQLRSVGTAAAAERAAVDVALSKARATLAAREEKVAAQQETLREQAERLRGLEAAVRSAEARAGELKEAGAAAAARAEGAAGEAARANQVIDKLSTELRVAREKGRRRGALAARQESELAARGRELAAAAAAEAAAQRASDVAAEDRDRIKAEAQELKGKLAEARQALEGNDQMIRWLNNQLNDAQLSYSSLGGRYPNRPPGAAAMPASMPPAGRGPPPQHAFRGGGYSTPHHAIGRFASSAGGGGYMAAPPGFREATSTDAAAPPKPVSTAMAPAAATKSAAVGGAEAGKLEAGSGRDSTPAPRTPRPPAAALRRTPPATAVPNVANAAGGSGIGSGKAAAMAATVFGSGQRPIYRSELAQALTAGQEAPTRPGARLAAAKS